MKAEEPQPTNGQEGTEVEPVADAHASEKPLSGPPNQARAISKKTAGNRAIVDANRRWARDQHQPFLTALHEFHGSLTALRELSREFGPQVEDWPDQLGLEAIEAMEGCSAEQRNALTKMTTAAIPDLMMGSLVLGPPPDEVPAGEADGHEEDAPKPLAEWLEVADLFDGDMSVAYRMLDITYRRVTRPWSRNVFYGSLLVSTVSALEVLLASMVRERYLLNPEALGDETTFTLKELESFSDISDAQYSAADKKASEVVRGGLSAWIEWLEKHPKIKLSSYSSDFGFLNELMQRRHIVVHNASQVSTSYLAEMKKHVEPDKLPEKGQRLLVDGDYLSRALDEIEIVGDLLAADLWSKSRSTDEQKAIVELYNRSYDLLVGRQWTPVAHICKFGELTSKEETFTLIFKVNGLIARKRLGEDIEADVSRWETSALGIRFRLAKSALLGHDEETATLAIAALKGEEVSLEALHEWPLLEDFRRSAEWEGCRSEAEKIVKKRYGT